MNSAAKTNQCACGDADLHVVARRATLDGKRVLLWSDGGLSRSLGFRIAPGVPARGRKTNAVRIGWLFLGEVEACESDELADLYRAAVKAVEKKDGSPGAIRAELSRLQGHSAYPKLEWKIYHADARGRPTQRVAILPRLRWPGLVVFDYCGGHGSKRGRYVLMSRLRGSDTCFSTGFAFSCLSDLWAYLETSTVSWEE